MDATSDLVADPTDRSSVVTIRMFLVTLAVAAMAGLLVAVLIPWHMDEFIFYHALACWQPPQQLNLFRESCTAYPTGLGPWEYQRSYAYAGIASSLVMAPFHAMWTSPWVNYVLGALFLVAIALGVLKSLAVSTRIVPVVAVFFPLTFTVLHDGGPVRISLLVLAWTPFAAIKFLSGSSRQRALWGAVVILAWMIATEDKPFFLYLIPGIIAFTLAAVAAQRLIDSARASWKALTLFFGVATTASVGLLLLLRVDDMPYLQYLMNASPSPGILGRIRNVLNGVLLTIDWPFYAHRVVSYAPLGLGDPSDPGVGGKIARTTAYLPGFSSPTTLIASILTLASVAGVVALYIVASKRQFRSQPPGRRTALLLLVAASTLWVGAAVSGGWASHHFVFAQVPLVGLLVYDANRNRASLPRLFVALVTLMGVTLVSIGLTPTAPQASREIAQVFQSAVRDAGPNTAINCSSWGCYYTYSFANERDIPVVFADNAENSVVLEMLARERDLDIRHLCMDCTTQSVAELYPNSVVEQVATGTNVWSLFRVLP